MQTPLALPRTHPSVYTSKPSPRCGRSGEARICAWYGTIAGRFQQSRKVWTARASSHERPGGWVRRFPFLFFSGLHIYLCTYAPAMRSLLAFSHSMALKNFLRIPYTSGRSIASTTLPGLTTTLGRTFFCTVALVPHSGPIGSLSERSYSSPRSN